MAEPVRFEEQAEEVGVREAEVIKPEANEQPQEQPQEQQPPRSSRTPLRAVVAMALITVLFFALALAQSLTHPWNSDTASVALQGWDLVHGHLLLHGWWSSDVNFYTFDAPIYGLCMVVLGLGGTSLHVAGALIYTLVFLTACWAAKGRSHGAVFWFRVALVALFMTAVLFNGGLLATVMVIPDHNGTIVFVFVAYVLYSRHAARRWTPWALFVLLTLGQLGDVSVRYVLVPSMLLVWAVDSIRARRLRTPESWLVVATIASVAASYALRAVMKSLGAYYLTPAKATIAPLSQWGWHFTGTWESLLSLFGVQWSGFPGATAFRAEITLAGTFALLCGVLSLLCVLIRWTKVDVVDRLLAVTCVVYVAAYEFSTVGQPGSGGGYEFVGVIAMLAVLCARNISKLRPLRRPVPRSAGTAVAALLAVISLLSGTALFQPTAVDPLKPLAGWLEAHDLKYGLAGYWNAAPITVYSGGAVQVRQIFLSPTGFVPEAWGSKQQWYEASENDARFVVAEQNVRGAMTQAQVVHCFGKPAAIYQVDGYSVLVYNYNLLTKGAVPVVPPGS
jgi:hypothetical protein